MILFTKLLSYSQVPKDPFKFKKKKRERERDENKSFFGLEYKNHFTNMIRTKWRPSILYDPCGSFGPAG